MNDKKVSIIIPTYNRSRDLARALKSVLQQTYSNWEVLVVDNYSSDNTDDVVLSLRDPRIKLLKIHNNGVVAASRNLGVRISKGDYVALLDSDDWWKPQKLELSIKYLNQGADIVYHDLLLVKSLNQLFFFKKLITRKMTPSIFNDLISHGNALTNSSVVMRRELLNKLGGFAENQELVAIEDYDAWLRLSKLTDKFFRIPKALGYYWAGGGNMTNPDRTLVTISAFENRYAAEILERNLDGRLTWIDYLKGRAWYLKGSYDQSKGYLRLVLLGRTTIMYKVKSFYMLLIGSIRFVFGKYQRHSK